MITGRTYTFGPHKVEYRYSGTGSLSPWHQEAYAEKNRFMMCTADVAYFVRVDNDKIYRIERLDANIDSELSNIEENYDYYPAEMEEKFNELLKSKDLKLCEPIDV